MKKTFKNIMLIVFAIGIFSGCERMKTTKKNIIQGGLDNCKVVIRDSCEYLWYETYGSSDEYTHKGDCKNCRAWYEKTINNTINKNIENTNKIK